MESKNCDHENICRCTKMARSYVMTLLVTARDLPQDVIPAIKPQSGRPPKTSKHTNDVRRRELRRNSYLSASELKKIDEKNDALNNLF